MKTKNWFEVDKDGLAKLTDRRDKSFVIMELVQNCWDENVTQVDISLTPSQKRGYAVLTVEDDSPEGFSDLRHAFTLFADNKKRSDPEKRGRFNLGEKLVLSLCTEAFISTTTGTVDFNKEGRQERKNARRDKGSLFQGVIRMNAVEILESLKAVNTLIPPRNITTLFNGNLVPTREPIAVLNEPLSTEIADEEGYIKKTVRKTNIEIYECRPGEHASIYEMGIPVVETGDAYHVNVMQKVPLNSERDNVTPSFLKTIRVLVLNAMQDRLTEEQANDSWVRDGAADDKCSPEAITKVMDLRFGEKRVSYDPSDPEANKLAVSKGYTVVYGNMMSQQEWQNARNAEAILPAGKVTPSPKPFVKNGEPLIKIPEHEWTPEIKDTVQYCEAMARILIGHEICVEIANDRKWNFSGCYGDRRLIINYAAVGANWFCRKESRKHRMQIHEFLIHELGHEYCSDHLSSNYHEALCMLAARLAEVSARPCGTASKIIWNEHGYTID